jgi:hypothetical protein
MEIFTFDGEDLKRNIVGLIHTPASVRRAFFYHNIYEDINPYNTHPWSFESLVGISQNPCEARP